MEWFSNKRRPLKHGDDGTNDQVYNNYYVHVRRWGHTFHDAALQRSSQQQQQWWSAVPARSHYDTIKINDHLTLSPSRSWKPVRRHRASVSNVSICRIPQLHRLLRRKGRQPTLVMRNSGSTLYTRKIWSCWKQNGGKKNPAKKW